MSDQHQQQRVAENDSHEINQKEEKVIQSQQAIIEVVDTKPQNIISNKNEILKIFENMNDEDEAPHLSEPIFKSKRSSLKKKQSENKIQKVKENAKKSTIEEKREKILKSIEPLIKKYKATNSPNIHDSEINKIKYEGKQKIFKYILYNIHELKQIDPKELNEQEERVSSLNFMDSYNFAKSIANEISAYFISHLNGNSRNSISKKFKTQWKKVISNIQDQNNFEFRTKISTKIWNPEKLAEADEIEFYPQAKRELIIQRNKRLINASTVEEKFVSALIQEDKNYESMNFDIPKSTPVQRDLKPKSTVFVEQATIAMIKQFLSQGHAQKMKSMIEKDIKKNSQLLKNMNNLFNL